MNSYNQPHKINVHAKPLLTRAIQGAGIAAVVVVLFLLTVGDSNPSPRFWMILPLCTVPIGGALGGSVYYLTDGLRYQGGWKKSLANLLSLLLYILLLMATFMLAMNGLHQKSPG